MEYENQTFPEAMKVLADRAGIALPEAELTEEQKRERNKRLRSFPRYGYEIIRLTSEEIEEIQNYRLILETGYLRNCYQNLTKLQLSELTRIADRCLSPESTVWEHWEANTEFHLTLLSFAHNRYASEQLARSMAILKRAYAQFYWHTWNQSVPSIDVQHHYPIIESLEKKDIERAIQLLKEDLSDFCLY